MQQGLCYSGGDYQTGLEGIGSDWGCSFGLLHRGQGYWEGVRSFQGHSTATLLRACGFGHGAQTLEHGRLLISRPLRAMTSKRFYNSGCGPRSVDIWGLCWPFGCVHADSRSPRAPRTTRSGKLDCIPAVAHACAFIMFIGVYFLAMWSRLHSTTIVGVVFIYAS